MENEKQTDFIQIWCKPGSCLQQKLMRSECASPESLSSLRPFLPRWQLICELKNFWYQLESYFPYYVNSDGGKVTLFATACSNFTGSTLASGMTMTRCARLFCVSSQLVSDLSSSSGPVQSPSDTICCAPSPPPAAIKLLGWPVLSMRSNARRNHQRIIKRLAPHLHRSFD